MTDLQLDDRDAVRTITIDRPQSRNGLTTDVCDRLASAVRDVPDAVHAIVLTGAHGAFCSGLDLKDALQRGITSGPELERGLRESFHGVIRALVESDRPTIALVDGAAAGFGCDLALACDLRVVSDRGVFGEIFVKRGLMPDGGGTWHLPRIVGLGRALEMMLTGELVHAEEALRIGLANRVIAHAEVHARTHELATAIANGPPLVHRAVKRAVYAGLDGDLTAALDREATGQLQLLGSRDFGEGVTAFLQKRPPRFEGR
ncbi:MAG: enoyl-CoA hydratase/isomerase family protein [Myxococcales bacterium]|nr:enoyl-CoA hydratase/isomerase family protein [Myxococcales bacterium]